MSVHEVRYMCEHSILPELFYKTSDRFVTALLKEKDFIYGIFQMCFERAGEKMPYARKQFSVEASKLTDSITFIRLRLPDPPDPPLCGSVILLFDRDLKQLMYFTVEKDISSGKGEVLLCAWTEEGEHMNYGRCLPSEKELMMRCLGIYAERYGIESEKEE